MAISKTGIELSIIIPTYNRADILKKCLEKIEAQVKKIATEIIIVDDGSDVKNRRILAQITKNLENTKVILLNKAGPAKARNMAMEKSRGKLMMFLNDDSLIGENFMTTHIGFHSKHINIHDALVGLTVNHPDTVDDRAMKWLIEKSGLYFDYGFKVANGSRIPWYYLWTCNFSVKREFIDKYKLFFCEDFPTAAWEDIEFAFRVKEKGLRLFFDDKAVVYHYHLLRFKDIKGRFYSHGRGLYHLKEKLPNNFLPLLVRIRPGKLVLDMLPKKIFSGISGMLENIIVRCEYYPNFLMQILVVKWKADGYEFEKKRMSGL